MISDITLGQFFPGNSPIHRLDPRTKIILTLAFIITVFFANNPISFGLLFIYTSFAIVVSRLSLKVVIKGIKPIIFIIIFTAVINVFMTGGEGEPLLELWIIKIYTHGIVRAVFMALRVFVLILGTSVLLTYTTSPIALTDGLETLLSPLKAVGIPVHTFAMMMSIALRFIPTLVEETEKIMNAQKSRGADFTNGSLANRAKALIPLLIPLFVSSFKRAEELATAMECRCYRGDKNRVKLHKLSYGKLDYLWIIGFLIFAALLIFTTIGPYQLGLNGGLYNIIFYKI